MKEIKNLKLKAPEGFEIKNLQRFPSMEYGPEGGLTADIYWNGKLAVQVYQEGNGGPADATVLIKDDSKLINMKTAALTLLKRLDKGYGPTGYNWLKTKTAAGINDDDWEAVVNNFEERYDDVKEAKKIFKQGYMAVAILKNDYETAYLKYRVADITRREVEALMRERGYIKQYPEFTLITCNDPLTVI